MAQQACSSRRRHPERLQAPDSGWGALWGAARGPGGSSGAGPWGRRPTPPVLGLDVHLQAVPARRPVAALLTHKELLPTVLESLVQLQFRPGQEALGTGRTLRDRVSRVRVRREGRPGAPRNPLDLSWRKPHCPPTLDAAWRRSARPQSSGPSGWPGTYRVGLGRSVQLDHVALQVLLLHELLRAGGALEDRPRSPEAPRLPGREPQGRAQPEMLPTGREGHTGEGLWCYAHAEAEAALRRKKQQPRPKMREHRTRDTGTREGRAGLLDGW